MFQALAFRFSPADVWLFQKGFAKFLCFTAGLLAVDLFSYFKNDELWIFRFKAPFQMAFYTYLFYALLLFGVQASEQFIYFQF